MNLLKNIFAKKDKISLTEVKKVAGLANLSLSDTELRKYQKELSGILSYVDIVAQAPDPEETSSVISANVLREDVVEDYLDFEVSNTAKKIYGFKKTDNS
jgi:aspartyl/glutamyl-tRNA(Asn/Gln) amidotransferase C subunit